MFFPDGRHLWYLVELFLYSLILLPVFTPAGKTKKSLLSWASFIFEGADSLLSSEKCIIVDLASILAVCVLGCSYFNLLCILPLRKYPSNLLTVCWHCFFCLILSPDVCNILPNIEDFISTIPIQIIKTNIK
jgi:hypothetical protein